MISAWLSALRLVYRSSTVTEKKNKKKQHFLFQTKIMGEKIEQSTGIHGWVFKKPCLKKKTTKYQTRVPRLQTERV